jgi:predicted esterase
MQTLLVACAIALASAYAEPPAAEEPITVADLRAGGDEHKRYFLIAPGGETLPPERGWKLLIVLPGGDGGADFHPFVRRMYENALPPGYLLAQAVAPIWTEDEDTRIVWPTRGLPDTNMKFPTEEFIAAIIDDIARQHPLDDRYIFALGWSSGGPPLFATAMQKETRLTGAFVAMSVFHPQQYPPAENARGRAFYLLHSPDDWIPMRFPEHAKRTLDEAGVTVTLQTYEGGHSWRGDAFGIIHRGITWLEEQTRLREEDQLRRANG